MAKITAKHAAKKIVKKEIKSAAKPAIKNPIKNPMKNPNEIKPDLELEKPQNIEQNIEQKSDNRKRMILHKDQLRTTVTVMGVIFAGIAIVIAVVAFGIAHNHGKLNDVLQQNAQSIHRIDNIASLQDDMMEDMLLLSESIKDNRQKMAIKEFAMDHYRSITTIRKNIHDTKKNSSDIKDIIAYNRILLGIIIAIVIIQGAVLYAIGIRMSHKYTGPLMVISNFLNDYIKNKDPELRPLRENDELREFYALFEKAVAKVRTERGRK